MDLIEYPMMVTDGNKMSSSIQLKMIMIPKMKNKFAIDERFFLGIFGEAMLIAMRIGVRTPTMFNGEMKGLTSFSL